MWWPAYNWYRTIQDTFPQSYNSVFAWLEEFGAGNILELTKKGTAHWSTVPAGGLVHTWLLFKGIGARNIGKLSEHYKQSCKQRLRTVLQCCLQVRCRVNPLWTFIKGFRCSESLRNEYVLSAPCHAHARRFLNYCHLVLRVFVHCHLSTELQFV